MLLGHGTIGQFAVAEALSGLVVNAGTVDVSMGQAATFSIGTEVATGTAVFAVTTAGAGTFSLGTEVATGGADIDVTSAGVPTFSIGDETAFGEAFQNLISFSSGSPDFFIWNETDDDETSTWSNVEPGSTD
tara:strand:- start:198 stop:593 length:396 start_codon:yes stop_codon:yes gene_type:complete